MSMFGYRTDFTTKCDYGVAEEPVPLCWWERILRRICPLPPQRVIDPARPQMLLTTKHYGQPFIRQIGRHVTFSYSRRFHGFGLYRYSGVYPTTWKHLRLYFWRFYVTFDLKD